MSLMLATEGAVMRLGPLLAADWNRRAERASARLHDFRSCLGWKLRVCQNSADIPPAATL